MLLKLEKQIKKIIGEEQPFKIEFWNDCICVEIYESEIPININRKTFDYSVPTEVLNQDLFSEAIVDIPKVVNVIQRYLK